jgi:hypothetical protein
MHGKSEQRAMRQSSFWYDTCPVCQGRGAVPCIECNGIGHVDEISHGRSAMRVPEGEVEHEASQQRATVARACTCSGCACETCGGRGPFTARPAVDMGSAISRCTRAHTISRCVRGTRRQNSPTISPRSSMSIWWTAVVVESPGMVMMSPAIGQRNPAPVYARISRVEIP